MNFYIKKIRLWFHRHPEPKEYEFKPNKVNVVTGDSSTGKSSILRVIDYCLMAKESTIVEDVINTNVSWYGLSASSVQPLPITMTVEPPCPTAILKVTTPPS